MGEMAETIFHYFLEQGSEILCAAGAVDPITTVSEVAMKVNYQLLSLAPSKKLEERCANLLEAIKSLPQTCQRFIHPVEGQFLLKPVQVQLVKPEGTNEQEDGKRCTIELPAGSTVADLRALVLKMFGGHFVLAEGIGGDGLDGEDVPLDGLPGLEDGVELRSAPGTGAPALQGERVAHQSEETSSKATKLGRPGQIGAEEHKQSTELVSEKGGTETLSKAGELRLGQHEQGCVC